MEALAAVLRHERGRLVALLARRHGLGAWAAIDDAVQAATLAALQRWPADGLPAQPAAWLYRSAHHHLIDTWRARRRDEPWPDDDTEPADAADSVIDATAGSAASPPPAGRFAGELDDDELALLFAACHPALPPATQVALALRAQTELPLDTIADALLTTAPALAQRLARARDQLR
ncbi:MAG: sigma factor, partial [Aquabacterium sp.]